MRKLIVLLATFAGTSAFAVTPTDPIPTKVLSCGGAIITNLGGRLEGDRNFSTGVGVSYNNLNSSVSYQDDAAIPAVKHSKIGDHVLMCLVFIPKNCPAGDDRGKIYTITNLRTLESWTLPDSEHSCGGA